MPVISRLPQDTVNRIAAGEVVERPASAIKELVENAIDAGATRIDIRADQGGLSRIIVEDDGCGMGPDDLSLCVERHATSKLAPRSDGTWDLLHIRTLGFRGEALPSIGSVARLSLVSRPKSAPEALSIEVDGGIVSGLKPAAFAQPHGTRVEVRDLFYATPARLKFMKSERSENMSISEEVKRQAMAHPEVGFTLDLDGRRALRLLPESADMDGRLRRLSAVMGADFGDNALLIDQMREDVRLTGFAGLPTFSRGAATHQYLFVNGRPVRDKLLTGALRGAYAEFLARDRHPVAALFVDMDPEGLDVNVHPAKTEVRFRDANLVRGLMVGALRHALAAAGHRAATTVADSALRSFAPAVSRPYQPLLSPVPVGLGIPTLTRPSPLAAYDPPGLSEPVFAPASRTEFPVIEAHRAEDYALADDMPVEVSATPVSFPLGAARAQLHETYIIAQTEDGLVIVDQHAAHERLVFEQMKLAMSEGRVVRQGLLIPEVVDLDPAEAQRLVARAADFEALGLSLEPFGPASVLVREVPALIGDCDIAGLVRDLADDLAEHGEPMALRERMAEVCGDHACRHSVRSGRRLTADEMNALLRQMEATPHSGQCNHGRPTYVELKLKDIERLFGRR